MKRVVEAVKAGEEQKRNTAHPERKKKRKREWNLSCERRRVRREERKREIESIVLREESIVLSLPRH